MSINFTAEIKATITYIDEETGNIEHVSTVLESTLDLGNFRALRKIMPDDGECCGKKTINGKEAEAWLMDASSGGGVQVFAAFQYLHSFMGWLEETSDTARHDIEVTVSWG